MVKLNKNVFIGYLLLSASFFIGFFHRFSPATFSKEIATSLNISAASIGAIAAMHFWVYTAMQIPAGILVDRYGVKTNSFLGTFITGIGAIILSLSSNLSTALVGPAMVGMGMASVFVGVMKYNSTSFPVGSYGIVTGVTMLIGTAGSIVSGTPSEFFLDFFDWRQIFFLVGSISVLLSFLILIFVQNDLTLALGKATNATPKFTDTFKVFKSKQVLLILMCTSGTNGTFYAFAGLWGVPYLSDQLNAGLDSASFLITLSLIVYGLGSLLFGMISDRLAARKPFLILASGIGACSWALRIIAGSFSYHFGLLLCILLGLSASQVVVAFSCVKESSNSSLSGSSLAFVNMGVFLTSAIVQFFIGVMLDWLSTNSTGLTGHTLTAYRTAFLLPFSFSAIGLFCSIKIKETHPFRLNRHETSS